MSEGYRVVVRSSPKRYAYFDGVHWSLHDDPDVATIWESEAAALSEGKSAPEMIRLEGVVEKCDSEPNRRNLHRERWEYRIVSPADIDEGQTLPFASQESCNALGLEGWECFHVNPGAIWFKRRLP